MVKREPEIPECFAYSICVSLKAMLWKSANICKKKIPIYRASVVFILDKDVFLPLIVNKFTNKPSNRLPYNINGLKFVNIYLPIDNFTLLKFFAWPNYRRTGEKE